MKQLRVYNADMFGTASLRVALLLTLLPAMVSANTAPGRWEQGPRLPIPRGELAVTAVGDRLYVIGGYSDQTFYESRVDVFDAITGRWSSAAPLPTGLNHIAVAAYDGRVYAFGGGSETAGVRDANVYDPSTNKWSPIAPLPEACGSISAAVLRDRIHLVGGFCNTDVNSGHSSRNHYVYDPRTQRYTAAAPLPVGRDHMGLAAYRDRLYAVGGRIYTKSHNTSLLDVYDPASNTWRSLRPMPSPRSGMAVATYAGKIFAIGGEGGREGVESPAFTANEAYDPVTNRWSEYAPLPEGRHGVGAAVIREHLYVPGGASIAGRAHRHDTLEVFTLSRA